MSTRRVLAAGWAWAVAALLALVVSAAAAPVSPAFTVPGGLAQGRIAFERDLGRGNREIFVMYADGSGARNVTKHPGYDEYPNWSPDGTSIAFNSTRSGAVAAKSFEIYVMRSDGSHVRRLTHNRARDIQPVWSPDGKRIAFVSDRDGNWEIYVMNANGTNPRRLTYDLAEDNAPTWSPDGRIAFESDRDGSWGIYVMAPSIVSVASPGEPAAFRLPVEGYDPAWSPDGRTLAFSGWRGAHDDDNDIEVLDLATGEATVVGTSPFFDGHAAWSPDGSKILFDSGRHGNLEVYVMNADGTGLHRLTRAPGESCCAQWTA